MNKIVLHIPHSSERLPRDFFEKIIISKQAVLDFCHTIADNDTMRLFGNNAYKKVVFKWSRIFCDVEKFIDPEQEVMSKFGMGVVYTHTNKGERFIEPTNEYIDEVIKKCYLPHHQKLDKAVQAYLKKNKVILVDCHSFCKEIIMFEDKRQNLPDICIGYNEPAPNKAAELAINHFKALGYSVSENYPYSGSMVPDYLLESQNPNFCSVMIEVNKAIYLNKPAAFKALQAQMNFLFKKLENMENI